MSMRIYFFTILTFYFLGNCFSASAQALVPVNIGATTPLAWGDYDNDGDMDLLQHNGSALTILKNDLAGTTATYVDAGIALANVNPSHVGWIDFNNDGYLDIYYLDAGSLKLLMSQMGVSFTLVTANLNGETLSVIGDWGDIDNDGDQDIVGGGLILRNLGNNRFEVSQRLGTTGRTELMDYDNDGDLDFYNRDFLYSNKGQGIFELTKTISPNGSSSGYEYIDLLFVRKNVNESNSFASRYRLLTGPSSYVELWDFEICGGGQQNSYQLEYLEVADFDNDGKNDVMVLEAGSINLYTSLGSCVNIASLAVPAGRTEVADFDKDGDLDVFIGTNVFRNTTVVANAAPATPANLTSLVDSLSVASSSVELNWSAATDDKTPVSSITYNLIIKRGPEIVVTGGLGAVGNLNLAKRGNMEYGTSWKIYNLPKGKYTWTVQAVDEAFKTSVLAAEKPFEIKAGPVLITPLSIPSQYAATYDEISDRFLLTYLKGGDVMGVWADGKTVQPTGVEFKINTASTASSHIVGYSPVKNEFMVSWLENAGLDKKIYAKNLLSTGGNAHAEKLIYSVSDTLKVFLGGDKVAFDEVSGKYFIPFFKTRTDLDRPRTKWEGIPVTYYPYGLLDVYGMKVSTNGTTLTGETPKLFQTKSVPSSFNHPITRNFTIQSAVDFDSNNKMMAMTWNFMGERRTSYGQGSSGYITSVLETENLYLVVTDENLLLKSETVVSGNNGQINEGGGGRNHNLVYNPLSDQFMFVWSYWQESTNGTGSDDYSFEVYQRIFSLQNNGTADFKNPSTLVSTPPDIKNYGSGLPSLSWSKKRNEYLISWTKGIAGGSLGVLADGDQYYRRVHPNGTFVDIDSRFISTVTGRENIVRNNTKYGHFLLGWRSGSQNYLSAFNIPKDFAKPTITSIAPDKAAAGAKVIITTKNLGNTPAVTKVMFGDTKDAIPGIVDPVYPTANPDQIQVTVPPGLAREKVRVVLIYDDQSSVEEVLFENISPTSVTNVTPLQGEEGDIITITGSNFPTDKNSIKVMFGSTEAAATDITSNTVSEIKVKVPLAAKRGSQTVSVVIQEIANDFAGGDFRVIRIPAITSVSSEVMNAGEEIYVSLKSITITGENLSDAEGDVIVKLNDVVIPEESLTEQTRTMLKFLIPIGLKGVHVVGLSTTDGEIVSEEFDIILGSTVDVIPDVKEVALTDLPNDVKLSMSVYNSETVEKTKLWTKGISEPDTEWKPRELNISYKNDRLDLIFTEQEFPVDPLGLDAYFEITDKSTLTERSDTFKIFYNYQVSGETANIPSLTFGGNVSDYNIISIPYVLSPNKINTVFKSIFDNYGYDKTKWRILHYSNTDGTGEYKEYLDGLDVIKEGKGYWIVVRNPQEITFEKGNAVYADGGPFEIELQPGWNQIGNPYDFNISWTDILDFNDDLGEQLDDIEPYKTFTGGAFVNTDVIDRYRGGFVRNNGTPVKLKIPFTKNASINNGRTTTDKSFPSDLNQKEWRIALDLSAGDLKNKISSFGMHPKGTDGKDQKDEHRLPSFIRSIDLEFPHTLSTSVVATGDNYTWDFNVSNTTDSKEITLNWDNTAFGDNDRHLFLHDRAGERLINMREQNNYTFIYQEGHRFNIYFGDQSYVEDHSRPAIIVLSDAYPNPMRGTTTIPFTVTKDQTDVQLAIYNLQGKEITTLVNKKLAVGFYELEWDGRSAAGEQIPSGVVMYRLQTSQPGSANQSIVKKLVIAP